MSEDVELAKAWLQGRSGLLDDLADLVEGMMDKPLDPAARTFISTIGSDASAMAKRETRPTPSARRTDPAKAQPPAEAPPVAPTTIDLNELLRRRRERDRAQRLAEFGRRNQEAWGDQAEMVRGMGAGGDWREER
jgi:hypothetical protein